MPHTQYSNTHVQCETFFDSKTGPSYHYSF